MAAPQQRSENRIQIRRTFAAPREKVFRAWTEKQALEQWLCRDVPTQQVNYRELDVRAGGRYVMEVRDGKTGEQYVGSGTFKTVSPPEKLVFTWGWTKRQADGSESVLHPETEVTVELSARGNATEMVVTHDFFTTTQEREDTNKGWNGCFDVLEEQFRVSSFF